MSCNKVSGPIIRRIVYRTKFRRLYSDHLQFVNRMHIYIFDEFDYNVNYDTCLVQS